MTDNSWIFKTKNFSGLLFKNKDHYNIKTVNISLNFNSLNEIEEKYGKITTLERDTTEVTNNINGYPVKDKNFIVKDEDKAIYSKKNSYSISTVEFCAGYWSIKYPNGWGLNLCPRLKTTQDYESQGPFRTRLECTNNNNLLNTRDKVKK